MHHNYGLDPVHFYTAPSWSAGLKLTKARLEIPHDINIHIFIDRGMRGGLSIIANQYAITNNTEMKEYYNPKLKTSYIFFTDANNLYGLAMSQPLLTGGFKWVKNLKTEILAITNGTSDERKSMREWDDFFLLHHTTCIHCLSFAGQKHRIILCQQFYS